MLQKVSKIDGNDLKDDGSSGLARLADGMTIEINPRDTIKHVDLLKDLPRGTRVFVTRLPKGSFEESLAACVVLRDLGLAPVPHVTARTTISLADLGRELELFATQAGVEQILMIAGTVEPQGAFSDTTPIFQSDVLASSGLKRIFVAGHPEGHPDANADALHRALMLKNEFAARSGIAVEIVTQFFFDAAPIVAWEKRIRASGNRLPIHAGLHGVTGITSLVKHGMACGVGASLKVLSARASNLLQMAMLQSPDDLALGLARAIEVDPQSLLGHVHLFPLGGLERTIRWGNAVQQGQYDLKGDVLKVQI